MDTADGKVRMPDFGDGARVVESQREKLDRRFDAFFSGKGGSFKEIYIEATGDRMVSGRVADINQRRYCDAMGASFSEAIDASQWGNVLGSALQRQLTHEYRNTAQYDGWRRVAKVVELPDFRTRHVTQVGGYGDLPIVDQGGPYLGLSTPADWEATYAAQKRGGTESITLEAIRNDDVSAISRVPKKMAHAGKRTLAHFVYGFLLDNPIIYDGVNLFDVSRGNLGSAALSAASLAARRASMMKQTELSSGDAVAIPPRTLLVPVDLEQTGWDLVNQRGTNLDPTFEQTRGYELVVVWYWTDPNDWVLAADPADIACIEVGFLDGNEEPELFVQDRPSVGSLFSHDQITYKIRHIYGGAVTDWRGLDKSVVA